MGVKVKVKGMKEKVREKKRGSLALGENLRENSKLGRGKAGRTN